MQWMQSLYYLKGRLSELERCLKSFLENTGFNWLGCRTSLPKFPSFCTPRERMQAGPHSYLLIIILQSKTTTVKQTINIFKANVVVVVTNHINFSSATDCSLLSFHDWTKQFQMGEKMNTKNIIKFFPIGFIERFHSFCKKRFRQKCFHSLVRNILYPSPFKTPLYSEMTPLKMLKLHDIWALSPFEL